MYNLINFKLIANAKELDNETSYTYFGARYYDSDLSSWLSVDPLSDKYPSLSPYCYSANNPVVLVDPNGMELNIYDDPPPKVVSNNEEAINHYYNGNGEPVKIGENITKELLNSKDFQEHHNNVLSGNTKTEGNFSVNMENKKDAFFIGNTRVDYEVTPSKDNKNCTVTYTIYNNDGFWDPNYVNEAAGKGFEEINEKIIPVINNFLNEFIGIEINNINNKQMLPDGPGPNLELGGKPYHFIETIIQYTFENPGYFN